MKIKGLRWGYDGGGFGCGPIEGNSVVEIVGIDESGELVFSTVSSNGEGFDFSISNVSLFDLWICIMDSDIDYEKVLSTIKANTKEEYCALWGEDVPEDLLSSKYADLMAMSFEALRHYMTTSVEDEVLPEEYIKSFIDDDEQLITVPQISFYDDDELD